jgi:hypothetical protein
MSNKITSQARTELVHALRDRYRGGTREEKGQILREFVAVSGYHRKHAIRILNADEEPDDRPPRSGDAPGVVKRADGWRRWDWLQGLVAWTRAL